MHAHPDDESSKGAPTVAKYVDSGAHAALVCCTGGEEGDILNEAMKRPEIEANLPAVRKAELDKAVEIIGYQSLHMLGYRDSGMPDSEANARPEAFANAPHDEAVEKLVRIIRAEKPHVLITYPEDQGRYQHPDHLRVTDISLPAWDLAGDPSAFPDAGEPWTPLKLYYSSWSRARILAWHETYERLGIESPYDEGWFEGEDKDHLITTKVEGEAFFDRRCDALIAHATQVDPDSPFWFGLPRAEAAKAYPYEDFILAQSRVESTIPETSLFAGVENLRWSAS